MIYQFIAIALLAIAGLVNNQRVRDLERRIESLERANGLIPGTPTHAGWKEGESE